MPDESIRLIHVSGECEIDLVRRELRVLGSPVPIGARAFDVIEVLAQSAGKLVTKDQLMDRIWQGATVMDGTLHVHAAAVRKALCPYRSSLKTESGRGYRLLGDWGARRHEAAGPSVGPQKDARRRRVAGDQFSCDRHKPRRPRGRVAWLRDLVSAYRVVTLAGPGGIGKTSLALKAARGIVGEFTDGAWLVELASLSDPALVPPAAAGVLRLPIGHASVTPETVARSIGDKNLLLVLDNCEQVIGAVATLAETILALCPRTSIITTSREILRIQGEHVYRVPPLEVPAPGRDEPDHILSHSAVALFIARTTALNSGFSPGGTELSGIGAICRHLDGIPLAIEFAAARAAVLGIRQVSLGLNDRFALLTSGRRNAVPRQRTLRAMLDWSYELLLEPEQTLLCHLGVFSGGFTLDAVAAVMEDTGLGTSMVVDCIASLVTKSLVTLDSRGASARWYLLETVRAYALDKLALRGRVDAVAQRHASYFRDQIAPDQSSLNTRLTNDELIDHTRDMDNVRAAIDWSFSPVGDSDIGRDLSAAYAPVWLHRGLNSECRERCEQALLGLEPDTRQNMWRLMSLQIALGTAMYITVGTSERTRTLVTEALAFAETLGDFDTQVWALVTLSALLGVSQNYGAARAEVERLQRIGERIGDPATVASADRRMGYILYVRGRLREAQQNFERALQFRFATDDRRPAFLSFPVPHHSTSRAMLGQILWLRGFAERAIEEANASLMELNASDHQLSLGRVLTFGICRIATMTGDLDTADREIARLIELSTRLKAPFWQATGHFLEGKVMVERGAFAEALRAIACCISI